MGAKYVDNVRSGTRIRTRRSEQLKKVDARREREWLPDPLDRNLSPYLAVLKQLERDIETGELHQGDRLPPHRTLASHIGVSIATVTKAYHEAQRRGLVVGERGRGMFVNGRTPQETPANRDRPIDLAYNLAPDVGQGEAIYAAMSEIVSSGVRNDLLTFDSYHGLESQRSVFADWVATRGLRASVDQLFITSGAQQGLLIAAAILRSTRDEPVMVEEISFTGSRAVASTLGFPLVPVPMDELGIIPDAVERLARETGARLLFVNPTIQSPTTLTIPAQRRREIASVIKRINGFVVEDDVYGYLPDSPIPPISSFIPDNAIYVNGFSKVLTLGFRIGLMMVPPRFIDAAVLAMRATTWTAPALLAQVAAMIIASGEFTHLVNLVRQESKVRRDIFTSVFDYRFREDQPQGFHAWLPLPREIDPNAIYAAARHAAVSLTPPGFSVQSEVTDRALRFCLGAPATHADLRTALEIVKRFLDRGEQHHHVLVV